MVLTSGIQPILAQEINRSELICTDDKQFCLSRLDIEKLVVITESENTCRENLADCRASAVVINRQGWEPSAVLLYGFISVLSVGLIGVGVGVFAL